MTRPSVEIDALQCATAEAVHDSLAKTTDTLTEHDEAALAAKKVEFDVREARLVADESVLDSHIAASRVLTTEHSVVEALRASLPDETKIPIAAPAV